MTEVVWRWHASDAIVGADWPGDQEAKLHIGRSAPEVSLELVSFGLPFSRTPEGKEIYLRAVLASALGRMVLWGLAAGDLVYGLCCPLPVKLQTPHGTVGGLERRRLAKPEDWQGWAGTPLCGCG